VRRAIGTAAAGVVAVMVACAPQGKGALVLAISTDMQAPKDVDLVSVYIETNNQPKFDYLGRVLPDGTVSLPSTLAIVEPDDEGAQVRIRVIAFQEQKARVLRDVLTTVPHGRQSLLRMPLNFLDDGQVTGTLPSQYIPIGPLNPNGPPDGDTGFQPAQPDPTQPGFMKTACDFTQQQTSINGSCASAVVDSSSLPDYSDSAVFGDGGSLGAPTCFQVETCFASSAVVGQVTMLGGNQGCSFPLPAGADPQSFNVALAVPGTGTPVNGVDLVPLESDPGEGFSVSGQTVSLVQGVCNKLKNPGTGLVISTGKGCAPKTESSPVCQPTAPRTDGGSSSCQGSITMVCASCNSGCNGGTVSFKVSGTTAVITSIGGGGTSTTPDAGQDAALFDAGSSGGTSGSGSGGGGGSSSGSGGSSSGSGSSSSSGGGGGSSSGSGGSGSSSGSMPPPSSIPPGTVDPATCTLTFQVPGQACDGGTDTWTFDLSAGTASVTDLSKQAGSCSDTTCSCTMCTVMNGGSGPTVDAGTDGGGHVDCGTGGAFCNGACVNIASDPNNCGGCGNKCSPPGVCSNMQCQGGGNDSGTLCGSGMTMCGGVCTNTMSDPNNCGVCAFPCNKMQTCQLGQCVGAGDGGVASCMPGTTQCQGNLVQMCMGSGTWGPPMSCPGGQTCIGNTCQIPPSDAGGP
jgi:hypothetical protein